MSLVGVVVSKCMFSMEGLVDFVVRDGEGEVGDGENNSRWSKCLKKLVVLIVVGLYMFVFWLLIFCVFCDEIVVVGEKCEICGKGEDVGFLVVCEFCDYIYYGFCFDFFFIKKLDFEWNCLCCLVGDG